MSIQSFNIELTGEFQKMIDEALTKRVGEEFDMRLKELQDKKNEIISGILLSIKKEVDIQTIGEKVTFTIKEIKK